MTSTESNEALKPPELDPNMQTYLAFQVLRRAGQLLWIPGTLIVVGLGYVGIDARQKIVAGTAALASFAPEVQRTTDSVRAINSEFESLIGTQMETFERQRQQYQEFMVEQSRVLGEAVAKSETARGAVESLRGEVESLKEDVGSTASDAEEMLRRLDDALEGLRETQEAVDITRAGVQFSLDRVYTRVYGTWSFVVQESRRTELASIPLGIRMGSIRGDVLRDFEVLSNAEVVSAKDDFPVGESRCVKAADGSWFRITPTYVVELFFTSDMAGLHVERRESSEDCHRGAATITSTG